MTREQNHDWNIVGNTASSGQTSSASVVVRSDGGGFWSASLNDMQFRGPKDTLLWRATRQACNGGITPMVVWRNDQTFSPFPAGVTIDQIITHSDGSLFDDDTGYYQSVIDITAGDGALRATSINIEINYAGDLMGGESFSIQHPTMGWRLYEIATVDQSSDTFASITFNPPLREVVTAGTQLEFDRPRCLMRLADSTAMDLNITTWPFSVPSVKFIESKYA